MFFGKHSKETIEKIRAARIGKIHSKETLIKISDSMTKKENKNQNSYRAFLGHVLFIYKAISKYARKWEIGLSSKKEFRDWATSDSIYENLYKDWKDSEWNKYKSPVVMRKIKTVGFVVSNLFWSIKDKHSWWSGDLDYLKSVQDTASRRQTKNNKTTPKEQEDMKQLLKSLRKPK